MEMMWGVLLILASGSAGSPVTSPNIEVKCETNYEKRTSFTDLTEGEFPRESDSAPSLLEHLNVSIVPKEGGTTILNISWALNIDSTLKYVEATDIDIAGEKIKCEYIPPLAQARITETKQIWFHHLREVLSADALIIQAANVPRPPYDFDLVYKSVILHAPKKMPLTAEKSKVISTTFITTSAPVAPVCETEKCVSGMVPVFGGLMICLMLLLFCFMIYKNCGANFALGFKKVATSPKVPILVVYPAENSAFQWAIVALAEFLQQHGGCSVAIDMWQQENIAKLGPMRWLVEQAKAAERVLIVCPQPSLQPNHSPQKPVLPGACIPAAAQDLYPLALNLVATHARNCSELARFWVVQLGETGALASELRACRTFCLMKDLNKLCRCLQNQRQDNKMKISDLFLRRGKFYSRNSTEKLHTAVQALNGQHASLIKGEKTVSI